MFSDLSFDLCLRFVFRDFLVQSSSPFSVQTKAIKFCSNDSLQFTNDCHWFASFSSFVQISTGLQMPMMTSFHHVSINMPSMPARYKLDTVEQNSCVTALSARRRSNVHATEV